MSARSFIARLADNEQLNFWLTNRIPRRLATRFVGWFARIEQPFVRDASIAVWRLFCDIDLGEAKKAKFKSLRDGFIRELKDGARPVDPDPAILASPCDAIVGASGSIAGTDMLQVKGRHYPLGELLRDPGLTESYRDGSYVTLRLTAAMYHRFHAPYDLEVEHVTHIWGDVWNVNPPTLKRVDRLYCKNERAVIRTRLASGGHQITLVPVAAVLVAGIRLRVPGGLIDPREGGPQVGPCQVAFAKGAEMGWFEHGSTIIVLAPKGFSLCPAVETGCTIRMGQPLMRLPQP